MGDWPALAGDLEGHPEPPQSILRPCKVSSGYAQADTVTVIRLRRLHPTKAFTHHPPEHHIDSALHLGRVELFCSVTGRESTALVTGVASLETEVVPVNDIAAIERNRTLCRSDRFGKPTESAKRDTSI